MKQRVRAHFTAIAPNPCPALSGLCSDGEEDCLVYPTSLPFTGTKPNSGWCVRQWQKTVPSDYNATIDLGSNTQFYVSIKASPVIRANNGKLNQPAFVALPPPLRPGHGQGELSLCRADLGECVSCTEHSFIELDNTKCKLKFTGKAAAGQYFIYLMAEDRIVIPKISEVIENKPLSAVPVHLSLTVEEWASSCSDVPVATGDTPNKDSMLFVLPYQQVNFTTDFTSKLESVSEIAVVGPPELFRVGFKSVGSVATMNMAWVRSENKLARLLPICFAVNTKSSRTGLSFGSRSHFNNYEHIPSKYLPLLNMLLGDNLS
ncbi:50S ribosomal protein L2 [Dissostichus eleginoides]|uniref:50S ribosomal protein L2 n=1 Tax=Dissostichus eleginoides TaxID=100907 RepID=A0AAD9F7A2_DISEL|nr:50S ribosomal protein L2 [Dissostichus eleginoides]